MRPDTVLIAILTAECLLFIQGAANYRSLVPVKCFRSHPRYKNYLTISNNQRIQQPNCLRYHPQSHSIHLRSADNQTEDKHQCLSEPLNQRTRRDKQWHNISEVKRDLVRSPPKANEPPPASTEPSTPPKPKPKPKPQKKAKKVHVEMVKITAIHQNSSEMLKSPMLRPPPHFMGPPSPGFMGPPGHMMPPPMPPLETPMGPIPRWSQNQVPPPPWAYHQEGPPPWAKDQYRRWQSKSKPRKQPKDALDRLLAEDSVKIKSDEKWPLKGDSDRHRWESREGSDIYWELESTKKLASWDPVKSTGPLWKGASRSSSGVKKWDDSLSDLDKPAKEEWDDAKHGGVPKPPLPYLKEYRRP